MQGEEQNWDKERRNTYIIVTKYIKKKTNNIIIFSGEGKAGLNHGHQILQRVSLSLNYHLINILIIIPRT